MTAGAPHSETSDELGLLVTPRRARVDPPHQAREEMSSLAPAIDIGAGAPDTPLLAAGADGAAGTMLEVVEGPDEAMVAAVAGTSLDARREQLQLQVSQLASHLRERLRDVDRRESRLNA